MENDSIIYNQSLDIKDSKNFFVILLIYIYISLEFIYNIC